MLRVALVLYLTFLDSALQVFIALLFEDWYFWFGSISFVSCTCLTGRSQKLNLLLLLLGLLSLSFHGFVSYRISLLEERAARLILVGELGSIGNARRVYRYFWEGSSLVWNCRLYAILWRMVAVSARLGLFHLGFKLFLRSFFCQALRFLLPLLLHFEVVSSLLSCCLCNGEYQLGHS